MTDPAQMPTRTADVGIDALDALLRSQEPEWLPSGSVLLRQGEDSKFAYYLSEGEIAVFAESDYGRAQLAVIAAPRLIGELGVLAAYPRTATIEACGQPRRSASLFTRRSRCPLT